jgi:hypothetical protein
VGRVNKKIVEGEEIRAEDRMRNGGEDKGKGEGMRAKKDRYVTSPPGGDGRTVGGDEVRTTGG